MKTPQIAVITLIIGVALGFVSQYWITNSTTHSTTDSVEKSGKPLYWVAPMDPSYKRDKPGKSPMGMDLIPIYAEDAVNTNNKPGTVIINSAVENNLGVKTTLAALTSLSPNIDTVGYVTFDESNLWQINVRVAGWIKELSVNSIGERINKGDILFTLYSPELIKAQEELLNAYRNQNLPLLDGTKKRLLTLGVDQEQIKAIIKSNKVSQSIEIKAPADGVIANLNAREGGYLSPAQMVISAGTLNNVWVDVELFERQAHWIKAGSQALMTLEGLPGREWQGEVDYVYPILDPKTRTLRVRLKFPNSNGELKPNMFANITLQPTTNESVLTIPSSSIIRSGEMTRVVLAEGDGKYRSARIRIGREANGRVEVLQGLNNGDRVVTSAQFLLDSESSQSAELSRINGTTNNELANSKVTNNHTAKLESIWATGEIIDVMPSHRMISIRHQAIPEWNWPAMMMNFTFASTVEVGELNKGQVIAFEIQKTASGQYEIIDYKTDENQGGKQ